MANAAPPAETCADWRFLVLAEIANFAVIRRHVGRERAEHLVGLAAERVRDVPGCPGVRVASRTTLEIEFGSASRGDLPSLMDKIQQRFAEPFLMNEEAFSLDLTLAAVASPAESADDVRMAEHAEDALARARFGERRVVRELAGTSRDTSVTTLRRAFLEALERDEFFVEYQPKLHIRQQRTAGAEALIRWRHPTRGVISPNEFIPLAEEGQLIDRLTLWTLRRVIADQLLLAAGGHDIPMFVNLSGLLLNEPAFIDEACAMVEGAGARIGFEITETSVIRDPEAAIALLKQIASGGVPIAIDDYGAGLSSLSYLKQLPASELKIDKLFVTHLTSSHRDPLIVRSTIDLAHAMEMEVTAEGVEHPAALALLSVMGCDMAQGYLISRPVGLDALRAFLDDKTRSTPGVHSFRPAAPARYGRRA